MLLTLKIASWKAAYNDFPNKIVATIEVACLNWLKRALLVEVRVLGYGSAGTPPWVDAEKLDEEKKKQQAAEYMTKIKALEKENEALKKRIKQLEEELKKSRK